MYIKSELARVYSRLQDTNSTIRQIKSATDLRTSVRVRALQVLVPYRQYLRQRLTEITFEHTERTLKATEAQRQVLGAGAIQKQLGERCPKSWYQSSNLDNYDAQLSCEKGAGR